MVPLVLMPSRQIQNYLQTSLSQIHGYKRVKIVVVVLLLFYVHGKHLTSCRDGQLT